MNIHCDIILPFQYVVIPLTHHKNSGYGALNYPFVYRIFIAIRLKIQTKSSHKTHKSQLLRLDFVNLKSWIAIICMRLKKAQKKRQVRPKNFLRDALASVIMYVLYT